MPQASQVTNASQKRSSAGVDLVVLVALALRLLLLGLGHGAAGIAHQHPAHDGQRLAAERTGGGRRGLLLQPDQLVFQVGGAFVGVVGWAVGRMVHGISSQEGGSRGLAACQGCRPHFV
jgi:hypothetical protein